MPTEEYIRLKATVGIKRAQIEKLSQEISGLLENCPHEELTSCESYSPGGFDYTATTKYWEECKLCLAVVSHHVIDHKTFG